MWYKQAMANGGAPLEQRAGDDKQLHKLILYRLDENADRLRLIETRIRSLELEVQVMRVKAGIWGLMAGLIPAAIIVATQVGS